VLAVEESSVPPPPTAAPALEPRRPRAHHRELAVRAPAAEAGASALLRQAGEARHRGDLERALAAYRRLQREFAATREATLSSVPLGGILMQQGQAARALEQYDRYLDAEPRGNLVPEALYGRGRALAALGRGADERETWRRLIDGSPNSAYDSHARRRLDELQKLK
jgi:tetratricopeptide (TPR) repeat protein